MSATVLNPRSPEGSSCSALDAGSRPRQDAALGYDQHYGVALARRFYQNKPPN